MLSKEITDYVCPVLTLEDKCIYLLDNMNPTSEYPDFFLGYSLYNNQDFFYLIKRLDMIEETYVEFIVLELTLEEIEDIDNNEYILYDYLEQHLQDDIFTIAYYCEMYFTKEVDRMKLLLLKSIEEYELYQPIKFNNDNIMKYLEEVID